MTTTTSAYLIPFELELEVTAEDLDCGLRTNECECPVSRAMRRCFPQARSVRTDSLGDIAVYLPGLSRAVYYRGREPAEVVFDEREGFVEATALARFVSDFDAGLSRLEPRRFGLELIGRRRMLALLGQPLQEKSGLRVLISQPVESN